MTYKNLAVEQHAVDLVEHYFDVLAKALPSHTGAEAETVAPPRDAFIVATLSLLTVAFKSARDNVRDVFATDAKLRRLVEVGSLDAVLG